MTTDNFCFYLQNRLIQASQTRGQWYSDTSSLSIPCQSIRVCSALTRKHETKLERLATEKHASLLQTFVNYVCTKFYIIGSWMTPPPRLFCPVNRNWSGNLNILPSQSIITISSSVQDGLAILDQEKRFSFKDYLHQGITCHVVQCLEKE
jgi:hypothetical protein